MPPQEAAEPILPQVNGKQSLFIIRHGDRWDYANPKWKETTSRPGDPPLSALGLKQASETGVFLDKLFAEETITDVKWMSSPFLRCLQTSNAAIDSLQLGNKKMNDLQILPEYSIFEWDGYNGTLHESLPELSERKHYFPRLNMDYESMFIPAIPEPRSEFHNRCRKVVDSINRRHEFRPATALIAVTHAAACIGVVAAATDQTLADVTPAAPCSIYRLWRTSDTPVWTIDPHDSVNSFNGHTDHLSELGNTTVPWNHFKDKKHFRGYSGPATSRFAPDGFLSSSSAEEL